MHEQPLKHRPVARDRIFDGVISVIGGEGLGRLTHRRVAQAAGVALAATTYHYSGKAEMIAHVSDRFLADYIQRFRRLADRCRSGERHFGGRDELAFRLVTNVASRHAARSLAWCEIIIDAARTDEGRARARKWFDALMECWRDLLLQIDGEVSDAGILSAIDLVIGMTFIVHALGLTEGQVSDLWQGKIDVAELSIEPEDRQSAEVPGKRATQKAQATRAQIVEAAIRILMREGGGEVSYRAIAEETGLTQSTPSYYFRSIVDLLREAESEMFRRSKERYRSLSLRAGDIDSVDALVDLTMAIYTREATEHAPASAAHYSIWLEAARRRELRGEVVGAVIDQARSWQRRLAEFGRVGTFDGLKMQSSFIGGVIRNIASGSNILEISKKRPSFLMDVERIIIE